MPSLWKCTGVPPLRLSGVRGELPTDDSDVMEEELAPRVMRDLCRGDGVCSDVMGAGG